MMLIFWLVGSWADGRAWCDEVDFAHEIVPILRARCGNCHSGQQQEGGFSINTRATLLGGGDSGVVVDLSDAAGTRAERSELFARVSSEEDGYRMPPEGPRLSPDELTDIRQWIEQGVTWEEGFSFAPTFYEPPLAPRRPELPAPNSGRLNPIDRILDQDRLARETALLPVVSDEVFLRRVYLDLIGLLPTPEERASFLADADEQKREKLVDELLARNADYAEHWLTFWNDLLRNDYTGTGFITGGRTQISGWLYQALLRNVPYDQFTRQLIAPPSGESAGFINGIRWRGEVSAGQTVEIQFAQSVGQTFLGINLKCASCHDSFVDRWKLDEAFGLAAIYSERPLELHRCDKPIGEMAEPKWLFPELGSIDPSADKTTRLNQLADLMTHPQNGRLSRTIVNRLWHRLMGRGIVHPPDAMQTPPWNEDLLDYLAVHLTDHQYDLKQTLRLITTSAAYQSPAEIVGEESVGDDYVFNGIRAKRKTAEQFVDTVWQLTGAAPLSVDAPVQRAVTATGESEADQYARRGKWIWDQADARAVAGGTTLYFRKQWTLQALPQRAFALLTCDNEFKFTVNGVRLAAGNNWEQPSLVELKGLRVGANELLVEASNGGNGPNPAGLLVEVIWVDGAETMQGMGSDASWEVRSDPPAENPTGWGPAAEVSHGDVWDGRVGSAWEQQILAARGDGGRMVRASLVKSDFLQRALGRPNRDQIVSVRPEVMTTLEAIDLSIGSTLAEYLRNGAERLRSQEWTSSEELVSHMYRQALVREPTSDELRILQELLGEEPQVAAIEDALWAVIMLPEFNVVR
jgi:hypothetical protein